MKATENEMLEEAIRRMKLLDLHKNAIKEFKDYLKLNLSEPIRMGGVKVGSLIWLNELQMKLVGDWQEKTGNLVYHVIHSYTEFGELYDCLYVSPNKEEWKDDRDGLSVGEAIAHCINVTAPDCSESGYIGVQKAFGGLVRTW